MARLAMPSPVALALGALLTALVITSAFDTDSEQEAVARRVAPPGVCVVTKLEYQPSRLEQEWLQAAYNWKDGQDYCSFIEKNTQEPRQLTEVAQKAVIKAEDRRWLPGRSYWPSQGRPGLEFMSRIFSRLECYGNEEPIDLVDSIEPLYGGLRHPEALCKGLSLNPNNTLQKLLVSREHLVLMSTQQLLLEFSDEQAPQAKRIYVDLGAPWLVPADPPPPPPPPPMLGAIGHSAANGMAHGGNSALRLAGDPSRHPGAAQGKHGIHGKGRMAAGKHGLGFGKAAHVSAPPPPPKKPELSPEPFLINTYSRRGIDFDMFFLWDADMVKYREVHAPPKWQLRPLLNVTFNDTAINGTLPKGFGLMSNGSVGIWFLPNKTQPYLPKQGMVFTTDPKNLTHNPLNIIKTIARPYDLVVLKVDLKNWQAGLDLMHQIKHDKVLQTLLDEVLFRDHPNLKELGTDAGKRSLGDAYGLLNGMRQMGIRSHAWM